uniref:Uncharacterized protein n=1 Tax=Megaselia scalaris TaxID=36166 RepID=T1H2I0_MEGSC
MKAICDLKTNSNGFQEGDLVILYNPKRKKGLCPKVQRNWKGPYKVLKRINDVVFRNHGMVLNHISLLVGNLGLVHVLCYNVVSSSGTNNGKRVKTGYGVFVFFLVYRSFGSWYSSRKGEK